MTAGQQLRMRKLWFGCGYLMLVLAALASLIPVPAGPEGSDKIAHILVYAILSAWFAIIVIRSSSLWWVFTGLVGFGILMEALQGMTGYRSLELADAIANSVGVCLGLVCRFTRLRQWLIRLDLQLAASR